MVEAADLLGPGRVEAGDVVIAMASSGLHSNGYSLVRHVLLNTGRLVPGPARRRARPHARRGAARADHGLRQGLPRPGPQHRHPRDVAHHRRRPGREPRAGAAGQLVATLDRGTWTPAPIFDLVRQVGAVAQAALERTLNCGVGMVAITAADDVDRARSLLAGHGVDGWVCGEIGEAAGARRRAGRRHA